VALVGHKLDEVLSVSDRVTVLRAGRTVLEADRSAVDPSSLVAAMVGSSAGAEAVEIESVTVGKSAVAFVERAGAAPPVARLEGVSVRGARGERAVHDVTLEVRRGEVVGVAGVEGNGQHELALVLAGRRAPDEGTATIPTDPSFIPQDRKREGLVGDFTLTENVALALHRDPAYRRGPFLRWPHLRERTRELLDAYSVKAPSPDAAARELSGGNQQRVVVARELGRSPSLLVAENPTRGLDVGAAAFVHARLRELTDAGVVLVSTDLDEVLRLSHRILVMVRGRLLPVPEGERSREGIGRMMLAGGGAERGPLPGGGPPP
jgi:simple sugar transport system ATP-binding protein